MALIDEPKEVLYRKIHSNYYDEYGEKGKKISPSAFKDKKGCSVNKLAGRNENKIIKYYESKWKTPVKMKAIVKITVQECLDIPTYPVNKPTCNNRFHAEIHDSACQIEISKNKTKLLANRVKIVETY